MKLLFFALVSTFIFFQPQEASAEPWISNRFAQNCAGCHAPGRLNRKPAKRRCTLSCQGCHVNPNGGGLRNAYGKWNSERWLRSFYTDLAWNKKSTAPLNKQHYFERPEMAHSGKGKKGKKGKKRGGKLSKKQKLRNAKKGAKLVGFRGVVKDESPYFESSNYESAKNDIEELNRIPKNDPYRIERTNMVTAGGDLRLFYIQQSDGAASPKLEEGTFYPMVFDFGVRVRPIRNYLSFVYEGRAINLSRNEPSSLDRLFGTSSSAFTRSAYLLVDDLWYNSYFQYGYFRPMFGTATPNHNALIADFNQLGFSARVKGAGLGSAPNVPFIMVNKILPTEGAPDTDLSNEDGYVVTVGLRFVRLGASWQGSYWQSERQSETNPLTRTMWNMNAGMRLGRLVLNGDITSVRKETLAGLDEANITTVEARYRVWREMYLKTGYTMSNAAVARNNIVKGTGISPGSSDELQIGVRAFILSGLDLDLLNAVKTNKEDGFENFVENTMSFQLHAYF